MLGLGLGTSKGGMIDALAEVTNTKSVDFDGSNDYITCGDGTHTGEGYDTLSVSFWIKYADGAASMPRILDKGISCWSVMLNKTDRYVRLYVNSTTLTTSDDVITDGWHHVAITYTSSGRGTGIIFIEGSPSVTKTSYVGDTINTN